MESTGNIWSINWTLPDSEEASLVLRVTGIHNPPFFIVGGGGDSSPSSTITGYLCDIWTLVASGLGLQYELTAFNSSDYGTRLDNGTWTGMIGLAAYNRADVLLSWYMHAPGRGDVLDFLDAAPVEQTEYAFYLAESSAQFSVEWASFYSLLKPLHVASWLVLLLLLVLITLFLRLTVRYNHWAAESVSIVHRFSAGYCQLATFMALVGQGWPAVPDSLAARIVTVSSRFLGTMVTLLYTANLISSLTLQPHPKPLTSLDDFASQTNWKFSTWKEAPVFDIWRESADPSERHLYDMREDGSQFLDIDGSEESHQQCLRPRVLCYYDLRQYFIATGEDACLLQPLLERRSSVTNNYIVLRKRLGSLRRRANAVLLRLRETGVLRRLRRHWFAGEKINCASHWSEGHPLSAGDTQAVLMVAPLGCMFSLLLLAAECAVRRYRSRRLHSEDLLTFRKTAPQWRPPSPLPADLQVPVAGSGQMRLSGVTVHLQHQSRPMQFRV